jgi:hypothetical protein
LRTSTQEHKRNAGTAGIFALFLILTLALSAGACAEFYDPLAPGEDGPPPSGDPAEDSESSDDADSDDPGDLPKPAAPVLQGAPAISYDPSTGKVSVGFTFDMAVQAGDMDGWTLTGNGTAEITAVPDAPVPGTPLAAVLSVANPSAPDKKLTVPITVMPVEAVFTRGDTPVEYTVEYADHYGAAGIRPAAGDLTWYYIPEDQGLLKVFTAVYTPNAPETVDNVEQGSAAVPYTQEISRAVLKLFTVTVGTSADDDRIAVKGTDLPARTDRYHPVIIDIGIPEGDNSGLPAFIVPSGALGAAGGDYSHIRLRANRGAYLVIEADGGNYTAKGNLTNGTAEVMGGGKLRNGSYNGSPLGDNAVTLVRLGSFYAIGPEEPPDYNTAINELFSGWFIGPAGENPRIQWGVGDQNGDYVEIRSEGIAFSANITVKKTLILDYSLWFINGPTLTIDAAEDSSTYEGNKGVFTANGKYRFYGTKSQSGGQNPANVMATVAVQSGSSLHGSFLMSPDGKFTTAAGWDLTVTNQGDVNDAAYTGGAQGLPEIPKVPYDTSRSGYCNWFIPKKDI